MESRRILVLSTTVVVLTLAWAGGAAGQETPAPESSEPSKAAQQSAPPASQTLRLSLDDALARARKNSTPFQAAQTDAAIARQDRYQAGAALLPSVTYNNEALYTHLTNNNPRFIPHHSPPQ